MQRKMIESARENKIKPCFIVNKMFVCMFFGSGTGVRLLTEEVSTSSA